MGHMVEMLIPIAFFATVFGIIFIIIQARNKERMALIEQGADPGLFAKQPNRRGLLLKIAMFIVGAGVGLILGSIISTIGLLPEGIAEIAMLMVCSGMALMASYFLIRKLENEDSF